MSAPGGSPRAVLSRFAIDSRERDDAFRLSLSGELDITAAGEFDSHIRQVERRNPSAITLDLRELTFIDSSGLRSILTAQARAGSGGWDLVIVEAPEPVQRVLRITGLERHLTIVQDLDDRAVYPPAGSG